MFFKGVKQKRRKCTEAPALVRASDLRVAQDLWPTAHLWARDLVFEIGTEAEILHQPYTFWLDEAAKQTEIVTKRTILMLKTHLLWWVQFFSSLIFYFFKDPFSSSWEVRGASVQDEIAFNQLSMQNFGPAALKRKTTRPFIFSCFAAKFQNTCLKITFVKTSNSKLLW